MLKMSKFACIHFQTLWHKYLGQVKNIPVGTIGQNGLNVGHSTFNAHFTILDHALYCVFVFFADENECNSNPCRNGATCANGMKQYVCLCRDDFVGRNCESGE